MGLVFVRELRSLKSGSLINVKLPPFAVITGPNGSGKSNLLEAINTGAVILDELGTLQSPAVRFFGPGQLVATAEGPIQPASVRDPWSDLYNTLQSWKQQAPQLAGGDGTSQENWIRGNAVSQRLISAEALEQMLARSSKNLSAMTISDFRMHAPLSRGIRNPFEQSLSELFLTYSERDYANIIARYRYSERGGEPGLSDNEFRERYGAPPWELLNTILQVVGLSSYRFEAPPEGIDNVNFEVFLYDQDDVAIRPGDLSSGERVLLALATSLHTGTKRNISIEFPKLLLLDEPDASLHPSMSRSLLTVLEEIFVKQYGVQVIMTTHSPTTVALAPEDSLLVMSRSNPRLRAVTTDEALNYLTVGIATLSVKLENRRQVFVESEYDQIAYQELYKVLKPRLTPDRSIEFIAAGKRDKSGGCDAVKRLVGELNSAGVTTVHGIVDRDYRQGVGAGVHYISDRHSVENLIFDPLLVGAFLLRQGIIAPQQLGLPADIRHFQLEPSHAQAIADHLNAILGFVEGSSLQKYCGGFDITVSVNFLEMRGHDLEKALVSKFQALHSYKNGLKSSIIKLAAADHPNFIPATLADLLSDILNSA